MTRALRTNLPDAARILTQLEAEDPVSVETRGYLLEFLLNSRRYAEANDLADQLRKAFPASSRIQFLAGKLAYRQRDYKHAVDLFREAHRLKPIDRTAYWLGRTLTQSGGFDEARHLLESVRGLGPWIEKDLAWLSIRTGDTKTAIAHFESYLDQVPDDEFARKQLESARAQTLEAEELVDEMGQLESLGEEVPENLAADYVDRLIRIGSLDRAREFVAANRPGWSKTTVRQVGWALYKLNIFDLGFDLLFASLPDDAVNRKYLSALENAAKMTDQLERVIEGYQTLTTRHPHLFGRIKNLEKRIE